MPTQAVISTRPALTERATEGANDICTIWIEKVRRSDRISFGGSFAECAGMRRAGRCPVWAWCAEQRQHRMWNGSASEQHDGHRKQRFWIQRSLQQHQGLR